MTVRTKQSVAGILGIDDFPEYSEFIQAELKKKFNYFNPFQKLVLKAYSLGIIADKSKKSQKWFQEKAMDIKKLNMFVERMNTNEKNRIVKGNYKIGEMVMFGYDPKHKDTLPYYDTHPVVFITNTGPGYFTAINLHYLPPNARAILLDALYGTNNTTQLTETSKLKISYDILNSSTKFKMFAPCFKKYLTSQLETPLIRIYGHEWQIAAFLPIATFKKASLGTVWKDSSKRYR